MVGIILFDYKASNLLGEFEISLNENFIQSNQNVRGAGSEGYNGHCLA